MIQTRSHLKQFLFSSSTDISISSDFLSCSNFFPSPRKQPTHPLPLSFSPSPASPHTSLRKSSTSLHSSHTLKTKKSFSSQTRSKLQQSAILKKAKSITINNDNISLKEKQEQVETYKKRLRDLKWKKAKLGEEVQNKQISQRGKARELRRVIGKHFGRE